MIPLKSLLMQPLTSAIVTLGNFSATLQQVEELGVIY